MHIFLTFFFFFFFFLSIRLDRGLVTDSFFGQQKEKKYQISVDSLIDPRASDRLTLMTPLERTSARVCVCVVAAAVAFCVLLIFEETRFVSA